MRGRKKTHEEIDKFFEQAGCKLLDQYANCETPMRYKCHCGNISSIKFTHFRAGVRCGCKLKSKLSIEIVAKEFESKGCKLLAKEFKSVSTPMFYICKCGRESKIRLVCLRKGCLCRACGVAKITGSNAPWYIKDRNKLAYRNKFKKRCYKILEHTLNMLGKKKDGHTYNILGYSPKQLQEHIELHPNWNIVKNNKWHLDHIFPIQAFVDCGISDIKLINSLDNLQPLSQSANNQKNAKYNREKFIIWLSSRGIKI